MDDALVEQKATLVDRLGWRINDIKYWFQNRLQRVALSVLRRSVGSSNYIKHAEREFKALGWPGDCEMQALICENIRDMLIVFATQGHSGSSAPYAINQFKKLADFEPLGPLTGEDWEWGESFCGDGTQQNNRCSHVFRNKKIGAYDGQGKVFKEENGCCYTNSDSRVPITFPYTPKTEYVDV